MLNFTNIIWGVGVADISTFFVLPGSRIVACMLAAYYILLLPDTVFWFICGLFVGFVLSRLPI